MATEGVMSEAIAHEKILAIARKLDFTGRGIALGDYILPDVAGNVHYYRCDVGDIVTHVCCQDGDGPIFEQARVAAKQDGDGGRDEPAQ